MEVQGMFGIWIVIYNCEITTHFIDSDTEDSSKKIEAEDSLGGARMNLLPTEDAK